MQFFFHQPGKLPSYHWEDYLGDKIVWPVLYIMRRRIHMHVLLPEMHLPTGSLSPVTYWYTKDLHGAPHILDTILLWNTQTTIQIGPLINGTRYWALQYGMPEDTHHVTCIIQ